ncbi:2-aminoethylphosphonate--pyruvate transaminase [Klebsiella pneumoniae]|uniref:2-aminoethylphosphonate--pyruvate transaminase n=1 Tax=Klebsiella pneumoniae TaxID=573 RepID=A0A2X3C903_KLEPN|nr:2-aminoethylphosphonate--pyruvate transaminase [Klebsiella pneumoniae]
MVRQMTSRNYLLLTPGPLTTSRTVKEAMLFDSCTWDDDYNLGVVQTIRQQLVQLATPADGYTAVLLQGSGSYAVEAVLGSVIGEQGKVLIVSNGAYGARMIEMAQLMGIACTLTTAAKSPVRTRPRSNRSCRTTRRSPISRWYTAKPPPAC